ncbi:hypothetical protein B0W44_05385 [Novibacillus thermophilus]|uniref:Tail spike domain-containing protein n=2 Tax=Novibacillus thermophilus TaxID=1471761 RepID=A0A1U9K5L4_9BACL|nr:hypothetical protein B0W44_05385 [Novibacillus thermophilus]
MSPSETVIHITDHQTDVILDTISDFWDDTHLKQLNGVETFDFTTFSDESYSEHLADRNRIVIPGEDGEFLEFIIEEVIQHSDRTKAVYASASYLELKKQKVIEPQTLSGQTPQSAVDFALSNTEWRPGIITFTNIRTIHIENHTNPYNLLRKIASEFDLELRFRVEIDHYRIIGRYVDLIEQVGEWRGREIVFGKDLLGIERKEKTDQVVTALIGLGPEREDGTRLEVFVEDLDALQRWGRGGRHLIEVYEPESTDQDMTESRLRELTENELEKRVNAIVEYEVNISDVENVPELENEQIRFGDTIRIKDEKFSPPLYLEARVHTQERSLRDRSRKRVVLGDFTEYTEEEVRAIWKQLRQQIQQKISRAELSEYAERKIHRSASPPENTEHLWLDITTIPNVLKRYDEEENDWVKITPTRADEVGAETPDGAQEKADQAEENAKIYSENFTINYAQKQITSSPTPPENPEIGDLWFDNSTEPPTFRRWNGLEWEKLSASSFEELEGMIDKEQLPDRVIDATKLAIDAVQAENLAENSVYAEAIQAEAVGAQAIAANAILAKHIAAGEVTANHLAADAVTANAIAAGAILSEHIASKSITTDKLMVGNLDNMIDNPNFIDSIEPHHVFMGRWGLLTGEQSFVQGKPSLECDAEELGGEQRIYLNGDHTIEVQPGERYYMTVWVRPSGPSGVTWNRLNLAFRCEDANGNYLAFAGSQTWKPGVDIPVRQWTQLSLIADIPAGAVTMAPTIRVLDDDANNISHYLFDAVNMRRMVDGNIITGTLDAGQVTIGGTGPTRAHLGVDNIEFYRNNNYTGQVTTAQYDNNRDQILVHSPNQSALAASDEVGWGSLYKGAFVEAHNTSNNANVNLIAYNGSRVSEFSISATDGAALFGGLTVYGGQSVFYDPIIVEPLSGTTALRLNIERAWEFRSYGTGSATELGLKALTAQKNFSIRNSDDQRIVDFRAYTSGGGMYVYRDFTVAGSKSAVVETENYGKRLMYALETPDSRFMDVIETTLEPGEHWIELNPMFAETINGYSVFPITQDGGRVQVLEREPKRFKLRVIGEKQVDVACWVYGKRIGHEEKYMEKVKEEDELEHNEH